MDVSRIGPRFVTAASPPADAVSDHAAFGAALNESVRGVEHSLQNADDAIAALATGQSAHIHEAMIAVEQAGIDLELMLQIRNKIIAAYEEISRMQM